MEQLDFLSRPSAARLRKEIQNICDSYSHPWDLLAELCQNGVDAIRLHQKRYGEANKAHKIGIRINAIDRSVEITDTGVGFDPENFGELIAPHGTDKVPTDPVIGQKGVGVDVHHVHCKRILDRKQIDVGVFERANQECCNLEKR